MTNTLAYNIKSNIESMHPEVDKCFTKGFLLTFHIDTCGFYKLDKRSLLCIKNYDFTCYEKLDKK
ncbi:CLUMA_CG003356, isoform A [Clunio marinus]|uniref:CLUMA_CG003356, isoform A n=1 Tax=Clunio marinus TaxID=568069 RepID=A0A1J1HSY0_9DIPT|nr:CLUMA_CG003356, isoform A [Clunio marinus]